MLIETSRLIMRNFIKEDIISANEYLSDLEVMRYIEATFNYQKTESFILNYGIQRKPLVYALVEKISSKVIGHIIFHTFESESIYELGWVIGRKYWGMGYGFEISKEVIKTAFKKLHVDKIVAETVKENQSSLALIKKLGMEQDESSYDLLVFSLKNYCIH